MDAFLIRTAERKITSQWPCYTFRINTHSDMLPVLSLSLLFTHPIPSAIIYTNYHRNCG